MRLNIKKSLAAATILFALGIASQASAQSVLTATGPKQMGAVDTSGCVATDFPADPNAQECGYIPSKPTSQIAQITSNEQCANLMRRVIPAELHPHFDFRLAQVFPNQNYFVCHQVSNDFDSSSTYPGEPGDVLAHGGLFREVIKNFKITPEYTKIPNTENRQRYGGDLIFGGWESMSDCSSTLYNGFSNRVFQVFLRVNN